MAFAMECAKCWEVVCECGHEYRDWSEARLTKQIEMLQRVLSEKRRAAVIKANGGEVGNG
jgi:hypothetical protein